jgi:hypothetical protein
MSKIENAKISDVSISMADHCCLTFNVFIEGDGWFTSFGGYVNGHGYLGSDYWDGCGSGIVAMMKIMDTVGVENWEDLKGRYVRVENDGWGYSVCKIGNIIKDKWFDIKEFFEKTKDEKPYVLDERKQETEDE